jgi:hypothetical protein
MQMLAHLNQSARLLALTGLQSQYPRAGEAELKRSLSEQQFFRRCNAQKEKHSMLMLKSLRGWLSR